MKRSFALLMVLMIVFALLTGCAGKKDALSPSKPVMLTMWHVYGSQTESPLNELIDEFNRTEGKENGVSIDDMRDFDRLFALCDLYYDWSDRQTLFQINDFYHYFLVNMASLGDAFIKDGKINFDSEAFQRVWQPMARAGIYGSLCVQDGYASDRWKTAEVLSNIGSSAGILYLRDYVTYPDNTTEDIQTAILPYPSFAGTSPAAVQRGTDLFAIRSEDERKNKAAALFANWITRSSHNAEFAIQTGYLPVTNDGMNGLLSDTSIVENEKYRMLYDAVGDMNGQYAFCALPRYEGAADVQSAFEKKYEGRAGQCA